MAERAGLPPAPAGPARAPGPPVDRPAGPPARPGDPRVILGAVLLVALGCAAAFLLAPPLGTDLSAQVARAGFYARHGLAPVDLGWYGGVSPYGYSLVTPPLMSWLGSDTLGPRLAGALALVVSALALALLLLRTAARRPLLAGLVGAACIAGNLVSGRVTYAVGVAFGLLALLALTLARRRLRLPAALVAAVLASAASPVAGLFVGLAGVAVVLGALWSDRPAPPDGRRAAVDGALTDGRRRAVDGALMALAAAVPMAGLALLFGAGGWMNISPLDAVRAGTASLAVALLVPVRTVRAGALLSALGVAAAYAVHTPVGLNATRLAAMFALPILVGYATVPAALSARARPGGPALGHLPGGLSRGGSAGGPGLAGVAGGLSRRLGRAGTITVLVAGLALLAVWQPPVSVADLRAAGDPTASRSYFQPLLDELARRPPARVEVVPTANYWEAAYVPEVAPLARGWLRQADQAYNRLFLDGSVDADSYAAWLRDNGVGYVALSGAKPSWVGRREAELIRGGLPYLTPVWQNADWTLYGVVDPTSIVDGARLVETSAGALTFDVPAAGETLVRIRWSRWLRLAGPLGPAGPIGVANSRPVVHPGCLAPHGDWTTLRTTQPGRYTITATLTAPTTPRCPH